MDTDHNIELCAGLEQTDPAQYGVRCRALRLSLHGYGSQYRTVYHFLLLVCLFFFSFSVAREKAVNWF